ncbi:uncharacterized protein LOC125039003 [Penaeus chinensis]|uniref:uncharacterized protein LOC125039003 n=1 Tax=Penaeus chinensis TaxID=139456 RepID=UPI001FB79F91|nr:uncharacterized protein LOC125039003 [Penaeus chinensis]
MREAIGNEQDLGFTLTQRRMGLHIKVSKTNYMSLNQEKQNRVTLEGGVLKRVDDFLYLGTWIGSSAKDIETRISKAWVAMNKMELIWKSDIPKETNISFFRTTFESVLLYGCGAWTLTQTLEKKLDGAYTKMLRVVQNVTAGGVKKKLFTNFYIGSPRRRRRSRGSRGRPALTFIDQLIKDTNISKEQLPGAMDDRELWRHYVMNARLRSP